MPVAEYMLHKEGHRRLVPEFIGDRGHWYNPVDHTYIGWIEENPDHYVPDTITYLTKEQFVTRVLTIHAANPLLGGDEESPMRGTPLTNDEVTLLANNWYDDFVSKNTAV